MKKIIMLAAGMTGLIAAPAYADGTSTDSAEIKVSVAKECSIGDIGAIDFGTLPIDTEAGTTALTINADSQLGNQGISASCNTNTNVKISSTNGGLLSSENASHPSLNAEGFTNLIAYHVGISGLGSLIDLKTSGTPGQSTGDLPRNAFHKSVTFYARILKDDNTGKRPLAGAYSDTAVVTLTAI
jgi:spore coat protein U-like protein